MQLLGCGRARFPAFVMLLPRIQTEPGLHGRFCLHPSSAKQREGGMRFWQQCSGTLVANVDRGLMGTPTSTCVAGLNTARGLATRPVYTAALMYAPLVKRIKRPYQATDLQCLFAQGSGADLPASLFQDRV
ncbi:unnamed protein product [Ectocarpus sp. 12 AP-2014]